MDFEGAVHAAPLIQLLDKMTEKNIMVEPRNGQLLIVGKHRKAGITMEAEIELPYANVETPTKWKPLPEGFADAIDMVRTCAGNDESEFKVTCVHIHPKRLEACDNIQLIRYRLKTGVENPVLIRHTSAKYIKEFGMMEFCLTESWMHFRNSEGVILSCRTFVDDYPDLSNFWDVEGATIVLPKGVNEAVDKAEIFIAEKSENNRVQVVIKPGKMTLTGLGIKGFYTEFKEINYKGEAIKFKIPPKLLVDLTEKYQEAVINSERIKVTGEKFIYVTSLGEEEGESEDEESTEESED